jgi:hypothetical protein
MLLQQSRSSSATNSQSPATHPETGDGRIDIEKRCTRALIGDANAISGHRRACAFGRMKKSCQLLIASSSTPPPV